METGKSLSEQAGEFRTLIMSEQLSEIDFDALAAWLGEIAPVLHAIQQSAKSLESLRQDYEGRIVGMVKGMAAADRTGRSYEDAISSLEALPQMTGEELVACYRRTSARFRDMFPSRLRPNGLMTTRSRPADMSVYT